jgi:hypothetical protein
LEFFIRAKLRTTSNQRAADQTRKVLGQYLALAMKVGPEQGSIPVQVPPMRGLDEDMREWSFFMILEHNTRVNRSITATVEQLARGQKLTGLAAIDPKTGVMPSAQPGMEQVKLFEESVCQHLDTVKKLGGMRGTARSHHPVFGQFDAQMWHAMFPFHLKLHVKQADFVVSATSRLVHRP